MRVRAKRARTRRIHNRQRQGHLVELQLLPDQVSIQGGALLRHQPTPTVACSPAAAIQIWEMESGDHVTTLRRDRPYERLDITGLKGLTDAEKLALKMMGAVEQVSAR